MKKWKALCCALLVLCTIPAYGAEEPAAEPQPVDVELHITADCINADTGKIRLDLSDVTQSILEKSPWMPGNTTYTSLRLVNDLPYPLVIRDWEVSWPSYDFDAEDPTCSTMTGATGRDGNRIPLSLNVYRCCNKPIQALYGKTQTTLTLNEIVHVNQKIEETYRDTEHPITSYSEYLCLYYGVSNLSELNTAQIGEVFAGNRGTKLLGTTEDTLQNDPDYYYVNYSQKTYYAWEMDREVIELGYNYYWGQLMAFCLDGSITDLGAKYQNAAGYLTNLTNDSSRFTEFAEWGIGEYATADTPAQRATREFLQKIRLEKAGEENSSVFFPSIQLAINGPMMGNAFMCLEVPNLLNVTLDFSKDSAAVQGIVFRDVMRDNSYTADDFPFAGGTVTLYAQTEDGMTIVQSTVLTDTGSYYFDGLTKGQRYRVQFTMPTDMNRLCTNTWSEENLQGSRAIEQNGIYFADFEATRGKTEQVNAGFYHESNSGSKKTELLNKDDHYAYLVGYPDGTIRPDGSIDREEVATIFFRLLTNQAREEAWSMKNDYSDVNEAQWSNNAISTLSNLQILQGDPNGNFRPNASITRAEFAAIASRFDGLLPSSETPFTDIAGHWAEAYIQSSAARGWISGYPDETFRPDQLITRAEAMTLVNRVLERTADPKAFTGGMLQWPDNSDPSIWYYAAVQEATNSHNYHDINNKEQWDTVLPPRDWTALEKNWSNSNSGETGKDIYIK